MFTNRKVFFDTKKLIEEKHNFAINETIIYELLVDVNQFSDFSELISKFDNEILDKELFDKHLDELLLGVPLQYVLGHTEFAKLKINLNRKVLIPRPETEELVNKTIEYINRLKLNHDMIADVCCGSGCIALAMKNEFRDSKVYATDLYDDPIKITRENSLKNNLKINVLQGDKFEPLINNNLKFDVLISNPPYIKSEFEIDENVLNNEPLVALINNEDIGFYQYFIYNYSKVLKDRFLMAFEIGYNLKEDLSKFLEKNFHGKNIQVKFEKDFYGNDRFLFILGGYENAIL